MRAIKLVIINVLLLVVLMGCLTKTKKSTQNKISITKEEVLETINKVNKHWQNSHSEPKNSFWHESAYQTGNIAAYEVTGNKDFIEYALKWANKNHWMGAKSQNKANWKYSYGETDDYVLFGDWQICFQTYIDLYRLTGKKDNYKIARSLEVMEYQMSQSKNDFWWWVDGLYMVMPVMTKLYKITGNYQYLEKLEAYLNYTNTLLWDNDAKLYYRDSKYIYPTHKTANGKKDFWARGNGWAFAAYAKVIQDLPEDFAHKNKYIKRFKSMAVALSKSQQPDGTWSRSILDPEFAPGPETSGTSFFTYGLLWGINNEILNREIYVPKVLKSWEYLTKVAVQSDGSIGYIQPIGEKAIAGQIVDVNSTADFGVGAFLLAASEMYHFLD